MRTVDQALRTILEHVSGPSAAAAVSLPLIQCGGRILAENLQAGQDLPPFSRATMDGFAIRSEDQNGLSDFPMLFTVVGESAAGKPSPVVVGPGQAVRIFTGASIPEGADAVVMVERTEESSQGVRVLDRLASGQNIAHQGEDLKRTEIALRLGICLTPGQIGLLAGLGRAALTVFPAPRVGILSTGSELAPPGTELRPGMIHESNGSMLATMVQQAGASPVVLGHVSDDPDLILERAKVGLECDLLLLSGGSSVGDYDFTPRVLAELGVEVHFDRVALKPGKPTIFGIGPRRTPRAACVVFGLPGNPISAFVAFHLMVRPALARRAGRQECAPCIVQAELTSAVPRNPSRDQVLPAILQAGAGGLTVSFAGWHGSGDLTCLSGVNALLFVPRGAAGATVGELARVLMLPGQHPVGSGAYFE